MKLTYITIITIYDKDANTNDNTLYKTNNSTICIDISVVNNY